MVAPTGLGLYSSTPINQNLKTGGYGIRPYETTRILLTPLSFRPKKNGPCEETPTADGLCPRQILGAPPPAWADHVRTHPIGKQKNLFPKWFLRSFFLKKATPAPAGAPLKQLSTKIYKKIKNFSNKKSKSSLQFGICVI